MKFKFLLILAVLLITVSFVYAEVNPLLWDAKTKTATGTSSASDTTIWTPASGNKIVLMGVMLSSESDMDFLIETGSTAVIPRVYGIATEPVVILSNSTPIWTGSDDATLTYTVDNYDSMNYSILLWGFEKD